MDAQAQALLDGVTLDAADFSGGLRQLAANSLPQGRTFLRDALRTGGQILAIVLLCALLCDLEEGRAGRAIGLAGALAMGVLGAQLLQTMGTASSGALAQLQSYTDVLLPALSMATASCGGFTAAATLQAGTVAFLALLCRLILHLLQPLALVYLAWPAREAAMGDETLAKLRGLVGWVIGASLKAVLFAFTAYLAISGAISGQRRRDGGQGGEADALGRRPRRRQYALGRVGDAGRQRRGAAQFHRRVRDAGGPGTVRRAVFADGADVSCPEADGGGRGRL